MISPEEEKFYLQWEKERVKPNYKRRPFLRGLSIGLCLGILVLILNKLGWYVRANMIANSRGNEIWIIIAIISISVVFAWLYQQFTTEMKNDHFYSKINQKRQFFSNFIRFFSFFSHFVPKQL
jgi:membrane protein YdbS with pleckstrin-like domain